MHEILWPLGAFAAGTASGVVVMAAFSIRSYRRGHWDGHRHGQAMLVTAVQRGRDAHAARVRELNDEHLRMVVELRQLRSENLHLRNRVRILEGQEAKARQESKP